MSTVRYIVVLFLTACCLASRAQSTADWQAKYPGEQAIVLDHSIHYQITIRDGQPFVQNDETQRILFLSPQPDAYLSRYGFSHSDFHELRQYSAYTLTADAKKIKVTDFKTGNSESQGIFYDDVKETSFDFPAVAPGAIGTLQTSMTDKEPHLLSPFFFTWSIPVVHSELKISFPKGMIIRYVLKGNDTAAIAFTREERHGETTYTFQAKELPAERSYEDAPGIRWYSTHVLFYIDSYPDGQGHQVPFLTGPDALYHLYRGYLKDINKEAGPDLRHIVDSLCNGLTDPSEKTRKIYAWVQQSIKYIAFEQGMEGFIPRDANLVCSRRFGDCKDMSSILTLMLRTAGIPAWYTWIGTRSLPYTYQETPLPLVDNHMISTVRLHDQYVFLDATDPFCVFGMPTSAIQDKQAFVAIDDSSYKILTVPIPPKDANQLIDSTILDLTPAGLRGRVSIDNFGYYSDAMQDVLSYTDERDLQKKMKSRFSRGSDKFQLDDFHIGDKSDKNHIRLTGAFTLQDYAKRLGDEVYINLNLFKFYQHEEIDYPKRKIPIEFPFLSRRKYVIVLNIPDGYEVSYVPPGKSYQNEVWGFAMDYQKNGRQLIFTQEFDNDRLLLQPSQFADWNKVLENLFPLYRNTVSLQKKP